MTTGLTQIDQFLLILIVLLNVLSFGMFYRDKQQAKKHRRRISERTLLMSAFFLGGIGAYLSMHIFRHKTKRRLFTAAIPLAALLTFSSLLLIVGCI